MKKFLSLLLLPKTQSDFEKSYLAGMNRIALWVCLGHIPLIALVAFLAGTGVVKSVIYTALVIAGPLLGTKLLKNARHASVLFGFTSMNLSALLIHFGQGPMQIEMHFHVFVFIALLSVFANPMPIVTAAATVAVHHLLFYFFIPKSVFNYEASVWVVIVHALFVVAESVAACFIARSFFFNVIGLEKIIAARTGELNARNDDMRLILDNAGQGFLTISLDGSMAAEHSSTIETFFGAFDQNAKVWEYLARSDAKFKGGLELGLEAIRDDFMPLDITLTQLPSRLKQGEKTFGFEYRPILTDGKVTKLLLVITDVTAELERKRIEAQQKEIFIVFESIMRDRSGFMEFFEEAQALMQKISQTVKKNSFADCKRFVHTLKGNAGVFGLSKIMNVCHEIETAMEEADSIMSAEDFAKLEAVWKENSDRITHLLGNESERKIEVPVQDLKDLVNTTLEKAPHEDIANTLRLWSMEPTYLRLNRIAEQTRGIAERLGKGHLEVVVDDNNLRLDANRWSEFWSAFTHVVRNAVDHGVHTSDEAKAKNISSKIVLRTYVTSQNFIVEINDNGRGINWQAVADKASGRGLPSTRREDLVEALFMDGVSTKEVVSEYSGRGVGMGAVRSVTHKMQGEIEVASEPGKGTTFFFRFPRHEIMHVSKNLRAAS